MALSTDPVHVKRRVFRAASKVMPTHLFFIDRVDERIYAALRKLVGTPDLREMQQYENTAGRFNVKNVRRDCLLLGIPIERINAAIEELRKCGCELHEPKLKKKERKKNGQARTG